MTAAERAVAVAVVGAGGWGMNHVRTFGSMPSVDLRLVCDRRQQVRDAVQRSFPQVRCVEHVESVVEDDSVDAVVIATDVSNHFNAAKASLQAGKDVLVEKPLTLSAVEGEELCALAESKDRILMVGHLLLYHPSVVALRRLLDDGELGNILYVTSQRLNLGVVRREENAWWSLAPHDLSVLNFLFDADPESVAVSGEVFLQKDRKIEDVAFATLRYPEGRMAHVHVSWLDPHKTRRLTVVGDRKMAVFDDTSADQKLVLYDKGVDPLPSAVSYAEGLQVRAGDIVIPAVRMREPLRCECDAFVDSVRTRTPPLADGRSGVAVVRVLEAGARSLAQQGDRVLLSGQGS